MSDLYDDLSDVGGARTDSETILRLAQRQRDAAEDAKRRAAERRAAAEAGRGRKLNRATTAERRERRKLGTRRRPGAILVPSNPAYAAAVIADEGRKDGRVWYETAPVPRTLTAHTQPLRLRTAPSKVATTAVENVTPKPDRYAALAASYDRRAERRRSRSKPKYGRKV